MSVTYRGTRNGSWCSVPVDGHPLDPPVDLRSLAHARCDRAPNEEGSAQLALAILADHAGEGGALRSEGATSISRRFGEECPGAVPPKDENREAMKSRIRR